MRLQTSERSLAPFDSAHAYPRGVELFRQGQALSDARTGTPVSAVTCSDAVVDSMTVGRVCDLMRNNREFAVAIHEAHAHELCRDVKLQRPLRQWELARLNAVTPEHPNRILKEMEDGGTIRRSKGWIVVLDVNGVCPDWDSESGRRRRCPRLS